MFKFLKDKGRAMYRHPMGMAPRIMGGVIALGLLYLMYLVDAPFFSNMILIIFIPAICICSAVHAKMTFQEFFSKLVLSFIQGISRPLFYSLVTFCITFRVTHYAEGSESVEKEFIVGLLLAIAFGVLIPCFLDKGRKCFLYKCKKSLQAKLKT